MADDRDDALSSSEDFENTSPRTEKEFLLLLISLYRDAPELWRVKSQFYHDKNKKALTLSRITNALKILKPNFTEADLKKRINILRTNFNREFNKKKSSMRSGAGVEEIYVPKLWYYNDMMFLADSVDIADTEGSVNSQNVSETDSNHRAESSQKKKMKTKSHDDLQLELMSVATSYFNKPEDEDEILAKAWVVQLKKLSETQKTFAKKIINDVLFEGEMGSLTRSGVRFLPNNPSMNNSTSNTPNLIYSSQSEYSACPESQDFRMPMNPPQESYVSINSPSPNSWPSPSLPVITESIKKRNRNISSGHREYCVPLNFPSPSSCPPSSLPIILDNITIKNLKNRKSPSKTFIPLKTTSSRTSLKTPIKHKVITKQETRDLNQYRIQVKSSDLGISTSQRIDDTQPRVCVREGEDFISIADYVESEVTVNEIQPEVPINEDEELISAANYFKNYSCF